MKSTLPGTRIVLLICLVLLVTCTTPSDKGKRTGFPAPWLEEITISQLQQDYAQGKYTIEKVISNYLDRIEAIDKQGPGLNSIIIVNPDALSIARELDEEMAAGKIRGPMHGIPVIIKDNIDTHDKMPNTAGSRALLNSYPPADSWIVKKLREAGAVILAKANLSEWANFRASNSSSGWSGIGGQTKNPYVLDRNPCGSSSGSGASVSANLCMVAIGTETNGSILCPSNNNGIVGLKPTVGLLSRSGIIPISFTQDTPGPMGRTVSDVAICLGALTGVDSLDSKTLLSAGRSYTDYTQFLRPDGLKGKRIGLLKDRLGSSPRIDTLIRQAVRHIESKGGEVVEVEFPRGGWSNASYQVLLYEFKDGINKYLGSLGDNAPVKDLGELIEFNRNDNIELRYFDQAVFEAAQAMGDLDSEEYRNALKTMHEATRENGIDRIMDENRLDAIMAPTGGPAWKTDLILGDRSSGGSSSYAAISGYPNITVPAGYIEGLPVGVSFFGRAWSEPVLLEIAYSYEQVSRNRKAPEFHATD